MLTYYITDRMQFATDERQLLQTIARASAAGVDFIQLREKDMPARALERLAREALRTVRSEGRSRLLINHRTDIALAIGADGVHLTGNDIAASDARALAARHRTVSHVGPHVGLRGERGGAASAEFLIGVSCHSTEEVRLAYSHGADFAVLAPVFEKASAEKPSAQGTHRAVGLNELRRACRSETTPVSQVEAGEVRGEFPVFALGGVDRHRAELCKQAGAAGVAAIRMFQQSEDLAELVRWLKEL